MRVLLVSVLLGVGVSNAWAVDVPEPVYLNTFTSSAGLTIVGNGAYEDDSNVRFGKFFHNDPDLAKAIRTNYLKLPTDVLSHSATSKAITIGFWVNKKSATDYMYCPIFSAYDKAPFEGTLANEETGLVNDWTMFTCESRGLLQYNLNSYSGGWCDFTAAQNDSETNTESTTWLDDGNWHYFTITMTTTKAVVYVDGTPLNSWTIPDASAFFERLSNLTYVCLGGNQTGAWADADPAFGFDDFAVYDQALSAEQIAQIMSDKTTTADITSLTASYTFDSSSSINPFNNGAIWHGTNVDAFLPSINSGTRGLTATAYFDSDTNTDGRQAFTIPSGDVATISMVMYNGYNVSQNNNNTAYTIYNSDGTSLVSFTYNSMSCNFTDVSFGGTTVDGFEAFSGQSSYNGTQGANGIDDGSRPFVTTSGYNPVITISIAGDGNVSINFVRTKNSAYNTTFSKKLSDVKMDLARLVWPRQIMVRAVLIWAKESVVLVI